MQCRQFQGRNRSKVAIFRGVCVACYHVLVGSTDLIEDIGDLVLLKDRDQIIDWKRAMGVVVSKPDALAGTCANLAKRGTRGRKEEGFSLAQALLGQGSSELTSGVASLDDDNLLHLHVLVAEYDPAPEVIRKSSTGASEKWVGETQSEGEGVCTI